MADVQENLRYFTESHAWEQQGDEWSEPWGGTEALWSGVIYPRIRRFLPVPSILEIAPGFGRWSHFLREYCRKITLVDLTPRCIEACRERFRTDPRVSCYVNDGRTLPMIPEHSVDFVFSFDSLVHVEAEVVQSYLQELAQKLSPDGVAFLHHSNMGAYPVWTSLLRPLPLRVRGALMRRGILDPDGWRSYSVSAEIFARLCDDAGLQCAGQELINWRAMRLTDCFSIVTRKVSRWAQPNQVVRNAQFMQEAERVKAAAVRR